METTQVLVLFGSNLEPEKNSRAAAEALSQCLSDLRLSAAYRSAAVGCTDAPRFINWVAVGNTDLGPFEFKFDVLRSIEADLGRTRCANVNAPRTVDLDLLIYGEVSINNLNAGLAIPDIVFLKNAFSLIPASELCPDLIVAGCDRSLSELASLVAPDPPLERLGPVVNLTV